MCTLESLEEQHCSSLHVFFLQIYSVSFVSTTDQRVHIDWRSALSPVRSVMMVSSAQLTEGGGPVQTHPLEHFLPPQLALCRLSTPPQQE